VAGAAALYARAAGFPAGPAAGSIDGITTFIVCIALLALLVFGLTRHPEKSARLIVASVTIAGTLSGLVLLKVWMQASEVPPVLFLATLPLGYLGLNWSLKGYLGSLSQEKTNFLMLASASLLGALIGTSLPTIIGVLFLLLLTSLDVLVVEFGALANMVGQSRYDEVVSVVTLPLDNFLLGIGDFLAYSILASAALRYLGIYGAVETSVLILLGAVLTFQITKRRKKAPGLLIPVGIASIPLILGLARL
jgi:hypothetical protein